MAIGHWLCGPYTALSKKTSLVLRGPRKSRVVFRVCRARAISRTLAGVNLDNPVIIQIKSVIQFLSAWKMLCTNFQIGFDS